MSIMSVSRPDASTTMYKHFASLVSGYVDAPEDQSLADAVIPIESIYKLLEMYRYDAFKDETRRGALALRTAGALTRINKTPPWHTAILAALNTAKENAFGHETSNEQAVVELEQVLKSLVSKQSIEKAHKDHARDFFNRLGEALA